MTKSRKTRQFEFGFAVGCFFFTSKKKEVNQFEFVKSLEQFLNKQTNISEVKCDLSLFEEDESIDYPFENVPEDDESEVNNFLPLGDIGIEFKLFLPEKNQKEIFAHHLSTGTENFYITIKYFSWGMPVVFVEPINPKKAEGEFYPLYLTICIVRECMRKVFQSSNEIDFKCLGPSPAHISFKIYSDSSLNTNFSEVDSSYHGIRKITYLFNPNTLDIKEIKNFIYDSLHQPYSYYYEYIIYRNRVLTNSCNYMNCFEKMTENVKNVKFYDVPKRYFIIPKSIHETFISLTEYELSRINVRQYIEKTKQEIKSDCNVDSFKYSIQYIWEKFKEIDTDYSENLKPYYDAINFHENRNKNLKQITIAIIAVLLGAIIGGISSYWLGS